MKFFEIIFILLLMLPVALLMRYFITKLSVQRPRPQRSGPAEEEEKPTISGWLDKRRAKKDAQRVSEEVPEAPPQRQTYEPAFIPRSPSGMKRSERVPFTEMYGQFDRQLSQQERDAKAAEKSGKARSETSPSKRQQRNQRQRARKRKRDRRS